MDKLTIHIARIVEGGICISTSDGHKVYDQIRQGIIDGKQVTLSFESVTRITTGFLNAAVGQLYGEFTEYKVRSQLAPPVNADNRVLSRLKLVVDRAKIYFKDQKEADRILSNATGIEENGEDH